MKKTTLLFTILFLFGITKTHSQIITTVAGNGTAGYSGDGGQATAAELDKVGFALWDASGNLYISDSQNGVIRKVNSSGVISTIAGNGTNGYSGDGGQATAAELDGPEGMAIDASGNFYIADMQNSRIRKINTSGVISTFAGNGTASYSGDGGQATAAELNKPDGIVFDASGNMYIGDQNNNRVRKVNTSGVISTFAGTGVAGFSGNGGQATAAELNKSTDVAIDGSGNFYIADFSNNRIRKVNSSGVISTVVGNGTAGFSGDGGQATAAEIDDATCKVDGSGNIYITDRVNNRERKVNTSGVISTICGNATAGYTGDGGQATAAELNTPFTCAFDNSGNLYIADHANNAVRVIYLTLNVTTNITGNVSCNGGSNGSASSAVTRGTSPYSYSWTGGGTNSIYTGLTAGTYTLTVTDADGITGTATATITQPTALSVTATTYTSSVCAGKKDTLKSTPSGGTTPYTYLWTPQAFGDYGCNTCQNSWVYPFGTTYTMTVTDAHGCTATASTSITVYAYPYTTIAGPLSPTCASNTDTLIAAGATSYLWSNSATTSAIIVTPSVSTTYSVVGTNSHGCRDSAYYTVDTDCIGNGNASTTPIRIVPSTSGTTSSFSTNDSALWFYFVPTDSNNQVVAIGNNLGMPVPHVHRLTLYDSTLNLIEDRYLPDMMGADELVIDAQHLHIGKRYLVRAARTPAHAAALCNPTPSPTGVCEASLRWGFQMTFRTVPIFIPDDSGSEAPSITQLYYEDRGQMLDMNGMPRYDIKAYTDYNNPAVCLSDSAVSFVLGDRDTSKASHIDTIERIDMYPTGSGLQACQRPFKMQKDTSAGYLNYFLGLVPTGITKVYGYQRVVYKNIYTNVDMHLYSNGNGTKFYFVCNPASGGIGAGNPASIQLQFKGATSLTVLSNGGLEVSTPLGNITFTSGTAYTDSNGIIKPKSWQAKFVSVNSTTVEFNTGAYNTSEPLVIRVDRGYPPNVTNTTNVNWSTYCNSNGTTVPSGFSYPEGFYDVSNDGGGNVYVTGYSGNLHFPVGPVGYTGTLNGGADIIALKYNSSDIRQWGTYYGGSANEVGYGIRADASGYVYITGKTNSTDFPIPATPPGAYQQPGGLNGYNTGPDYDAFILKLNSSGTTPIWATYYGADTASEVGTHLVVDGLNNIYVVGGGVNINTVTFPLKSSTGAGTPYNSSHGSAFILEFSTAGKLEWSTRIGSSGKSDVLNGCALDGSNNFYVVGTSIDTGYTRGYTLTYPFNAVYSPSYTASNAVATKFNTSNNIQWSTYYGGNVIEYGNAIAVDYSGNAYITGVSFSDSVFSGLGIQLKKPPFIGQYYQKANAQSRELITGNGYIAEFSPTGSLKYGTYFGDSSAIIPNAITIDKNNALIVSGVVDYYTPSKSMPLPHTEAPSTYADSDWLGYIGTPALCNGSGYGDNQDVFIAAFSDLQYVWGTLYGPDWGTGASDYNGSELYIIGNGGIGGLTQTSCLNPMILNQGPIIGTSYFQSSVGNSGGSPIIGEFGVDTHIISALNTISPAKGTINVFPNPTTQDITVEINLEEKEDLEISLTNLLGQALYSENLKDQMGTVKTQISLSSFAEGTYILKVNTKDNVYCKKVIKLL